MIEADSWCDAGSLTMSDGLAIILNRKLDELEPGQTLRVHSVDANFAHDVRAWARLSGHQVVHWCNENTDTSCWIRRGSVQRVISPSATDWDNRASVEDGHL